MAHYAFLNKDNIVVEVIVGIDENETIEGLEPETWYENQRALKCKRTSYNANIRKNYAGIGYFYDEDKDAFIPPQPYPSWTLNEISLQWEAPIPMPEGVLSYWNEDLGIWENA